jgi:hypothetical protein
VNNVLWAVALCRSCVNRRFGGLQPPADVGSPLADFSTLKVEAIRCSEDIQSATSQKTAFFIVTAGKTSNLTKES